MKAWIAGLGGLAIVAIGVPASADTFTLWVRSDGSTFMPKLVDAFNASQSEHKAELQIVPVAELVQKYAVAAAGGTAPDALSLDLIYTPAFAAAGQLEDLTDFAKGLPYFDALSKAHLSVGTYDGKIYGVPFSADASVLIWNKDLFAKAGLDPEKGPTTWAEIHDDAAKVAALGGDIKGYYFSGNCGGCNIFTFTPLIWASGGDIFADNGRTATLDTPQMRDAIAFYRGMVGEGLRPPVRRPTPGPTSSRPSPAAISGSPRPARSPSVRSTRSIPTCTTASPCCPARTAGRPPSPAATTSSSRRARRRSRRSRPSSSMPTRSKARRCSPTTARCRCATTSPRTR